MRLKSILLGGALAAAFFTPPLITPNILNLVSAAHAQNVSISFSVFYDGLRDDGDWTNYNGSYVFVPSNIDANWRPYTRGHWVHTAEFGWVWESAERFGWATYHYGRWGYARDIGWYWVPGRRWAPAWVSWRRSDNDVMWAPLPPTGYDDEADSADEATLSALPVYFWVSIPTHNFQDPDLSARIVFDANQNQRIFEHSHFDGAVAVQNNVVVNNVINVNFIQQQTGKPVQNVGVTTTTDPARAKAPQPGGQNAVTAFQGQLKVDPAVKPVDVKPVAQVQQKVVNQPKLPTDTAPPTPAATPAAGATKPAAGVQPQGNAQVPTPKPGDAVTPPKADTTVVPSKPADTTVTPPKGDTTVVPSKPVDKVPPAKLGTTPVAPKTDVPPIPNGPATKGSGQTNPPAVPMSKQIQVAPSVQAKPIPAKPPVIQVQPKDVAPVPQMNKQPAPPKVNAPPAGNPKPPPPPPPAVVKKPVPPDQAPACKQGETGCPPNG